MHLYHHLVDHYIWTEWAPVPDCYGSRRRNTRQGTTVDPVYPGERQAGGGLMEGWLRKGTSEDRTERGRDQSRERQRREEASE